MIMHLSEEEEFLLLGKVSGTLNSDEEVLWKKLVQDNPSVLDAYNVLRAQLPDDELNNEFAFIKQDSRWKNFQLLENTTSIQSANNVVIKGNAHRRISLYRNIIIAAALIIFIFLSTFLWERYFNKRTAPTIAISQPTIQLKTAEGTVINLSDVHGNISTATADFTNKDNSLSYSAKSADKSQGINKLTVPVGMNYKIVLSDGTEVWLNASTEIDFPSVFTGSKRNISLKGEAYLNVKHDTIHPFIVYLPNSTVQVLGTQFNINTYDENADKVALIQGKVSMNAGDDNITLLPGKEAVYEKNKKIAIENFNAKYILSWREGKFYFNGATLVEINKVVPRWYGIKTVIDNPSINDRQFAGVLDKNLPITSFLDDLKAISKIDTYFDKDSVLHFK